MKNTPKEITWISGLAAVLVLSTAQPLPAQTDNFDSGSLDPAWKRSNFNPALVNESFSETGMGKGLRIQANPFPNAAPAAALLYRDEVYTNFYVAIDVTSWPGTDKNQAFVLVGRGDLSSNPATTTGVIMNYDASQYGENPGDRRQGQFQINLVTNTPDPFETKTIAMAELTLEPGRPYRFVFKGVGSHYTGMVYDHEDLTKPLVTIEADDVIQGVSSGGGTSVIFDQPFVRGKCGFLSFSRQGTSGSTDVTLDNYYAGSTDSNPAQGTALAHPVPGTPTIESRVPSARFKNFHNPADGISFTIKTFTADIINAAATRLRLNGADVSSNLVLSPNGTTVTGSLPGNQLTPNTAYSASIEVEDLSGAKKSTNTFWFDTFSDAYLATAPVKAIEAEDYNYNAGQYQLDPVPVSGFNTNNEHVNGLFISGLGYYEQVGVEGTDFHDARNSIENPWFAEYRNTDPVGLCAGIFPEQEDLNESATGGTAVRRGDHIRSRFASSNLLEYVVHRTEPGEWLNYTRSFAEGSYRAYLRVASFGSTMAELHKVTSDPAAPDQTTVKLGSFNVPNMITRYNYRYIPLVDDTSIPVTVPLDGTNTLRLAMAGTTGQDVRKVAINYLLFVPQAPIEVFSSATLDGPYTAEASAVVDTNAKRVTIPLGTGSRFFRLRSTQSLRITDPQVTQSAQGSGKNVVFFYE